MHPSHRQSPYRVRCDWGVPGADAITADADVAVVVDVLSFTTTLSVALDLGTTVLPYRWNDGTADGFAAEHDAVLAVGRSVARPGQISLSPASVRAAEPTPRLVLPSPNGSTICRHLAGQDRLVFGACLRNARAVAEWIAAHRPDAVIAVVPAGERWPGGELRPAAEDLWGAGAVIDALERCGFTDSSPEAAVAGSAFRAVEDDLPARLRLAASGAELIANGYPEDVEIAAETGAGRAVPVLRGDRFEAAT